MPSQDFLNRAGQTMALATQRLATVGIKTLHAADPSRQAAAFMALSAVSGSLNVLAAIIGNSGDPDKAGIKGLSNDSLLLAALLVTTTVSVSAPNANTIAADIDYGPQSLAKALELFTRVTGRDGAAVLDSSFSAPVVAGTDEANKLLGVICANKKPA